MTRRWAMMIIMTTIVILFRIIFARESTIREERCSSLTDFKVDRLSRTLRTILHRLFCVKPIGFISFLTSLFLVQIYFSYLFGINSHRTKSTCIEWNVVYSYMNNNHLIVFVYTIDVLIVQIEHNKWKFFINLNYLVVRLSGVVCFTEINFNDLLFVA